MGIKFTLAKMYEELDSYKHSRDFIMDFHVRNRLDKNLKLYETQLDTMLSTLNEAQKLRFIKNEKL